MSENIFFIEGFDQIKVNFNNNLQTWVLQEKVLERKTQLDRRQFNMYNAASEAWAVYICENLNDRSEKAIIKIYMQYASCLLGTSTIPNSLTEFLIWDQSSVHHG
jgi:hypothetical protein